MTSLIFIALLIIVPVITVVLIIIASVIVMYNRFVSLRNKCDESFSTMDVYLKKRYDMIPNLVESVKKYASHEKEVLENVTKARNIAMGSKDINERTNAESALSGTLKTLFAVAENYPDLKANTNFLDLQRQLEKIETDIAQSRKYYNAVVQTYNTTIEKFPAVIIANMFGQKRRAYFVIEEEERDAVKFDL